MAHIEKRNGKWQAAYRGPDKRERTKTFRIRADAEKWLDTQGADVARGLWVDPALGKVTFRDYAKTWLTTKADVSERTLINIEGRIDNHAKPFFGDMQMSLIRQSDVRRFVATLTATRAPSTVAAIFRTTSQVFASAVADGIIGRSPCVGVGLPSDRNREPMHFLTAEQVNALAKAVTDRYRAAIFTAAYGGLRAGELWALQVSDLDLLAGRATVDKASLSIRGHFTIGPTKTGRTRTVALPRFLCQMLGEHIGTFPSNDGLVFSAREGGPVHHRNFYRRHFQPAVLVAQEVAANHKKPLEAPPDGLRFHDLRHTCAAFLIASGRHMEEVKDHLGHQSIRVTSDRYGHLFPSAKVALADALDSTFAGASQTLVSDDHADFSRTTGEIVAFRQGG